MFYLLNIGIIFFFVCSNVSNVRPILLVMHFIGGSAFHNRKRNRFVGMKNLAAITSSMVDLAEIPSLWSFIIMR